ncbi:MAG: hypothetical protein ABSA13_10045 [Beijerinckiaceae bacterium]|jgi:hypothetical protein
MEPELSRASKITKSIAAASICALLVLAFAPLPAEAGPPYLTDDPEPVDYQHFELITYSIGTHVKGDTSGMAPGFDFNYGLIPNGHLHLGASLSFDRPGAMAPQFGYGDSEIGFKYRFIQEDEQGWRPQVALYPIMDFPTGDQSRALGAGHTRTLLPIWVQKSYGDWTVDTGGGYWINNGGGTLDKDYWFSGLLVQRKVAPNLTLGGELFHQTATVIGGKDSTGFNLGAVYDFDEHNHLMLSAGRGLQNAVASNEFSWFLGYQIIY